ncbi:MAG: hypothetical protein K1X78_26095 [Verrucomicrobiaceae bacterium]|nr:hypothetical protein [Verrucomicrobiaceae bacterium]
MKTLISITGIFVFVVLSVCQCSSSPRAGEVLQIRTYQLNGHTFVQERVCLSANPLETRVRTRQVN